MQHIVEHESLVDLDKPACYRFYVEPIRHDNQKVSDNVSVERLRRHRMFVNMLKNRTTLTSLTYDCYYCYY